MAAIFIDELGMKALDINLGVEPGTHGPTGHIVVHH
jgi:hypothetical protein